MKNEERGMKNDENRKKKRKRKVKGKINLK
jgi:hypothetical protein